MAISHLIAHRLQRNVPSTGAVLQLRDDELPRDGKIEECARELKLSYVKKLGKIHGRFSSDAAAHPLSSWINECLDEKLSFVSLTKKAMQHLKSEIDKTEAPIDAYVFFVQENFEHSDELYIYFVQNNAGQYLDGDLEISDCIYLDTHSINLAAKLNLREWQDDDSQLTYLGVLPWRGEKEISDAFVDFVGFTDKADVKVDTEAFLEAVENYTKDQPEEIAVETREKVVNYCLEQDKAGKRVVIADLSHEINPEKKEAFKKHVSDYKPQLKAELIPDRAQLRQFIRISGRDELLSMSFDSKCLGQSIVYDSETDALVIKKIPSALKSRLLKHLKNG
ncbi:MAG: nucleoid-associated protein [Lentisphaeria bacterium]|jgi:nucleoid-associated protein